MKSVNTITFTVVEGLNKAYLDDREFQIIFKMFRMLSLVPETDLMEAFDALVNSNKYDKRLDGYKNYFKVQKFIHIFTKIW